MSRAFWQTASPRTVARSSMARAGRRAATGAAAFLLLATSACDLNLIGPETYGSQSDTLHDLRVWLLGQYPKATFVRSDSHCDLLEMNFFRIGTCQTAFRLPDSSQVISITIWTEGDEGNGGQYFHLMEPDFDPYNLRFWANVNKES